MRFLWLLPAAALLIGLVFAPAPVAARGEPNDALEVCATCRFATIEEALAAARPGGAVRVLGGHYAGPLTVTTPVRLEGVGAPVIDGGGQGTVVRIGAADTTFQGFVVRNSGANLDREDSGLIVDAPRVQVRDNQFLDDLFGIYVRKAPGSVIERNHIVGKRVAEAQRGDGIKVWYSDGVRLLDNRIEEARDGLIWFSQGTIVSGNTIARGRYGLHLMYSDGSVIERNQFTGNSVGVYIMFGRDMTVRGNLLRANRGPSGHGLGLKEVDRATIEENTIVDNRIGIYVDNSPYSTDAYNYYRRNLIAYNDSGLSLLPANRNSIFSRNSLIDNLEQVTVLGSGHLGATAWAEDGQGNFWSDYAGYDADGDGIGNLAYRSDRLSEQLMDSAPLLQLFRFSAAATAVDFAARAMPVFQPEPKLIDPAPLTAPVRPPGMTLTPAATPGGFLLLGGTLLLLAGLLPAWAWRRTGRRREEAAPPPGGAANNGAVVELRGVTKRYGDRLALDDFTLSIGAGEALALWGRNGAGKTTVLRCLLGLTGHEGTITVAGVAPGRAGARVRALIGYVPQEMPTFDLTVGELAGLVARLRGAPGTAAERQLARFGLAEARDQAMGALSGGMKQKLALALALLGEPPILLLDEPTANLDAASQVELLQLLLELKREGRTLIFTSHRWHEVSLLADRVIGLERGRTIAVEQPGNFVRRGEEGALLHVQLGASLLDPAEELLRQHGFVAHRNGKAVLVRVDAGQKAEPLVLLAQAGYPVADFELERER